MYAAVLKSCIVIVKNVHNVKGWPLQKNTKRIDGILD